MSFQNNILHSLCILLNIYFTDEFGIIEPGAKVPVTNSVTNKGVTSKYYFSIQCDTELYSGAQIDVEFPSQFESGLGIDTPSCNYECSVSGNVVTFYIDEIFYSGTIYELSIDDVMNPETKGGTGNFLITSKQGANVVDKNLFFYGIGIAGGILDFPTAKVELEPLGLQNAGSITRYIFSFTVNEYIPSSGYFKFALPDMNFQVAQYPICDPYPVNGITVLGKLTCESDLDLNEIYVDGLDQDLFSGDQIAISLTLINPPYSYVTDYFQIYAYKPNTTNVYERKINIDGVEITPGVLDDVSISHIESLFTLSRNKELWFELSFKVANPIPEGGIIQLEIPVSIPLQTYSDLSYETTYYVYDGLEDLDEINYVSVDYDPITDILIISNFKKKSVDGLPVVLRFLATSPDNVGSSSPINITSYMSSDEDAYVIDQDTTFATMYIEDLESPTTLTCTTSSNIADNSLIDIDCAITPTTSIPANGYIKFIFDPEFTVNQVSTTDCYVYDKSLLANVVPPLCDQTDTYEILMELSSEQFTQGLSSTFGITNKINAPTYGGDYFVEITTYQKDGETIIESGIVKITFTARPFTTLTTELFNDHVSGTYYSAIKITLTTNLDIPAAITQNRYLDETSFFHVQFIKGTATYIPQDLGWGYSEYGDIPCVAMAGLTPIEGEEVTCVVFVDAQPYIKVTNFEAVAAGTYIELLFPKIENPDGSFKCDISAAIKFKHHLTFLNYDTNGNFGVNFGAGGPYSDYTALRNPYTFYSMTSLQVSDIFDISFSMKIRVSIAASSILLIQLPSYDLGFVRDTNDVTCEIDSVSQTCYAFETADRIVLIVGSTAIGVGKHTLDLYNLQWPRYSKTNFNVPLEMLVISSTTYSQTSSIDFPYFPTAEYNILEGCSVTASKEYSNAPDVVYTFTFIAYNDVPVGSTIILVFSFDFELLEIEEGILISSEYLIDQDNLRPVDFYYSKYKVTIFQFAEIKANTFISIDVIGVTNPNVQKILTDFAIEIRYADYLLNYRDDVFSVDLSNDWDPFEVTMYDITVYPLNAATTANYYFSFSFASPLSKNGEIHIQFPNDYKLLPSSPECYVSGALTSFLECYLFDQDIIMVLDTSYTANEIIYFNIFSLLNPDQGVLNPISIFSQYDSKIVNIAYDTNEKSLSLRTLTILSVAYSIEISSFTFEPINEREEGSYTLTFLPTSNLETDMQIVFLFPNVYDYRLGYNPSCEIEAGLTGSDISCIFTDRKVYITGFEFFDVSQKLFITITLSNIINPNRVVDGDSGYIEIATTVIGSTYFIDYNSEAGLVETSKAPGWVELYNFFGSNYYSRLDATYELNATFTANVPKSSEGGSIKIYYPSQFKLVDETITCTDILGTFGKSLTCKISNNIVAVTGNTNDFNGNFQLQFSPIENPDEEVPTDNLYISSYDSYNKKVIERSFEGLDPFYFSYTFPGPQIIVNNNQSLTLTKGVYSDVILIQFEELSRQNLTIVPSAPPFTVIPYAIKIAIGELTTFFKISIPMNFESNTYTIAWSLVDEEVPAYYTPIKRTVVKVVDSVVQKIRYPTYVDIPLNGTSLPIIFSIGYSPDIGITIQLNFEAEYKGIQMSTDILEFNNGLLTTNFSIYFSNLTEYYQQNVTEGEVILTLGGVNKDLYQLTSSSVSFSIIEMNTNIPEITEINVTSVLKTNASIIITATETAMIYYMIALNNTKNPSFSEVLNGGPSSSSTTNSVYANGLTDENYQINLFVTNLVAQTDYSIYVYALNKGFNYNPEPAKNNFTTPDRYQAAELSIRFNQYELTVDEKKAASIGIAYVLSLPESKVTTFDYILVIPQVSKYFSTLSGITKGSSNLEGRLLNDINSTILNDTNFLESQNIYDVNLIASMNEKNNSEISNFFKKYEVVADDTGRFLDTSSSNSDIEYTYTGVKSTLSFLILPFPESSAFQSPKTLGQKLNDQKKQLLARLPNLDISFSITTTDFPKYYPLFVAKPFLVSVGQYDVIANAKFDNYGYLYVVAIYKNLTDNINATAPKPSPYQISIGCNYQNEKVPSASIVINKKYTDFNISIIGLKTLSNYTMYLVGGSINPGYPDLMTHQFIEAIDFQTLPSDKEIHLNIDKGEITYVSITILIILMIIYYQQNKL